jgi:hypothetical protein
MNIPMLDEGEATYVFERTSSDRFPEWEKRILQRYLAITGFNETNVNAVFHHLIGLHGPPCGQRHAQNSVRRAGLKRLCFNNRCLTGHILPGSIIEFGSVVDAGGCAITARLLAPSQVSPALARKGRRARRG